MFMNIINTVHVYKLMTDTKLYEFTSNDKVFKDVLTSHDTDPHTIVTSPRKYTFGPLCQYVTPQ
jgi:hypothetical protein